MEKFDTIVVGAGTGGCMAAKTLAVAGLKTCLIDRKTKDTIGEKICGDAIGHHHFVELGLEEPTGKELERRIEGIRVYSPDNQTVFEVKGEKLHGYLLNRYLFGQRLLKQALDSGAILLESTQALEPVIEGGFVKGVIVKNLKTEEKKKLLCQVVVDASGFSAVIRKKLPPEMGIDINVENEDVEACYREIRQLKEQIDNPNFCNIYLNQQKTPGGYAWIFPKAGNIVNVGLGVAMRKGFPNPKNQLYKHFISMPMFKDSTSINKGTWYDPTRRPLDCMVGNGIAIVGDAACQVNPIHGGGMGPSMLGGLLAGKTIAEALEKGDVSRKGLWAYNVRYIKSYGIKQAGLDVFRAFLQATSDEDLNYGMKYELITEEDLLKASQGEDVRLNITDATSRVFKGLRKFGFLMKLREATNLMKKVKAWYNAYPTLPEGFEQWKKGTEELFDAVKSKF
jgi:geranylgeranyl reductase family protein